jgi:hypothetical protein
VSTEKIYLSIMAALLSPGVVVLAQYGQLWGWALIGGGIVFAALALRTIKEKGIERQRRERIRGEISELLATGINVCNLFNTKGLPDGPTDKCVEIQSFRDWRQQCRKMLIENNLRDWEALYFADTSFRKHGATAQIYIQACNRGVDRIKRFLEELRRQNE